MTLKVNSFAPQTTQPSFGNKKLTAAGAALMTALSTHVPAAKAELVQAIDQFGNPGVVETLTGQFFRQAPPPVVVVPRYIPPVVNPYCNPCNGYPPVYSVPVPVVPPVLPHLLHDLGNIFHHGHHGHHR